MASLVGGLVLVGGIGVGVAWWQFDLFEQVDYDPGSARERLDERATDAELGVDPQEIEPDGELPEGAELDGLIEREDEMLATLVLGSDARSDDTSARADAIMLVVLPPPDGGDPVMTSIPRDLWVPNPCTGGMSRINAGLNGCGDDVSGPELMSIMVEDLAGIGIDHYAEVDFDGFVEIVDAFGGVEICTDNPVRDERAELELPGGCVDASGEEALAWARSRQTQELVDGTWQAKPGVGVRTRDERQQDLALMVAERIAHFDSVNGLRSVASGLQDSVVLDSQMTLTRAVSLAWEFRDLDMGSVERVELPVSAYTTSGGAEVVRPEADLRYLLAEALNKEPSELAVEE